MAGGGDGDDGDDEDADEDDDDGDDCEDVVMIIIVNENEDVGWGNVGDKGRLSLLGSYRLLDARLQSLPFVRQSSR